MDSDTKENTGKVACITPAGGSIKAEDDDIVQLPGTASVSLSEYSELASRTTVR